MKAASKRSGLSPHVIRIWERRYNAVRPERSSSNRRLYSQSDIRRLDLLRHAVEEGHAIGQIAELSDDELRNILSFSAPPRPVKLDHKAKKLKAGNDPEYYFKASLDAVERMDSDRLEHILEKSQVECSLPVLIDKVIIPLLYAIGDRWQDGTLRIVHEHIASAVVHKFLENLERSNYEMSDTDSAPRMVVTTPAGQIHEFGALIALAAARAEGWWTKYLGVGLPAEEIAAGVLNFNASMVALSIVYPPNNSRTRDELMKLRSLLPPETDIITGGRAAESYDDTIQSAGMHRFDAIDEFRIFLSEGTRSGTAE